MSESDTHQPTRRLSLTKKQLQSSLGAELLAICQQVTADGRLTRDEAEQLRRWLDGAGETDIPAILHLREIVAEVLTDGELSAEDLGYMHAAVEAVMPKSARVAAISARKAVWAEEDTPIRRANFMVAGVKHDGRADIIRQHCREGDRAYLVRVPSNGHSKNAIAVVLEDGQQIGFVPEKAPERFSGDPLVPLAPELARLMDGGAEVAACITRILSQGEHPIPVVEAHFFRPTGASQVSAVAGETSEAKAQELARSRPSSAIWAAVLLVVALLVILIKLATK